MKTRLGSLAVEDKLSAGTANPCDRKDGSSKSENSPSYYSVQHSLRHRYCPRKSGTAIYESRFQYSYNQTLPNFCGNRAERGVGKEPSLPSGKISKGPRFLAAQRNRG